LWLWIKSYGGLSDLKKYNANLRKYNANLRKYNEGLRKSNEELEKSSDELRKSSEELEKSNEEFLKLEAEKEQLYEQRISELRRQNARLAELELKLDIVLSSSDSYSTPAQSTDDN
jgi:chromosome segregation ATPase